MKLLVVITVFVVATFAEPPVSKSYLPPSSQGGYPQGPQNFGSAPQVVAARSLEPQGHKGLERSNGIHGSHGSHGSHGQGHGGHSDDLANGFGRSALGHGAQGRFAGGNQGYDHNASPFGRNALEESSTVSYEADERGFKPHITYEDTESDAAARNGGYDSNANNLRSANDHHGDGHGNGFGNGGGHHSNGFAKGGDHHGNGFANGAARSGFANGGGHHADGFNGAARSSNGY
ncbi:hypothetical protein ACJJTC_000277 [Scirpophaga incertulas]